ncbi:pyrroline-5-carboxylate reductase [Pararhizobium haloflavum]|uniref:pyrroline-5-carboxylate reductase n=1 Tax=Pararhizobium haloflavum TaxID=2037914 RepID=UPI000C19BA2B|nr:pyrroline-5-carboxylate reductase [Pararhizobium haloflavum]
MTEAGPVVLVGAGNMGGAMMRGWLDAGLSGSDVVVVDPSPSEHMRDFCNARKVQVLAAASDDLKAGVLFLAVKPQMMGKVLPGLRSLVGPETVAVSVAAGTTIDALQRGLGDVAIVRAMPNTPAMVGRGITAAVPNGRTNARQRAAVDALLKVSGPVEWLDDESLIDAVTAVSGSGPAYVFYLAECMAEAGRKAGLPADLAMRLARATVSGAGELMHRSDDEVATLRKNVTSPNGTTAAALEMLMAEDGMQPLFDKAVAAAKRRAQELAKDD